MARLSDFQQKPATAIAQKTLDVMEKMHEPQAFGPIGGLPKLKSLNFVVGSCISIRMCSKTRTVWQNYVGRWMRKKTYATHDGGCTWLWTRHWTMTMSLPKRMKTLSPKRRAHSDLKAAVVAKVSSATRASLLLEGNHLKRFAVSA
jgi:hypothetical protein